MRVCDPMGDELAKEGGEDKKILDRDKWCGEMEETARGSNKW